LVIVAAAQGFVSMMMAVRQIAAAAVTVGEDNEHTRLLIAHSSALRMLESVIPAGARFDPCQSE
jgi:hypothetical protein